MRAAWGRVASVVGIFAMVTGLGLAPAAADETRNLHLASLSTPPLTVGQGGQFAVDHSVTNTGNTDAVASVTEFFLLAEDDVQHPLLGTSSVGSIAPEQTVDGAQATVTVPASTPVGTYLLGACVDATEQNVETDEDDNCAELDGASVEVVVPRPDLVVTAVSEPPAARTQGQSLMVSDKTKNIGDSTAGTSATRYYLFTPGSREPLTGAREVPQLAAGSASKGERSVTIPVDVPPGTYLLQACADARGEVDEYNEDLNCRESDLQITVKRSLPDLVVTAVTDPPDIRKQGASFSVTDTTKNGGLGTAAPSETRYHLSADRVLDASDRLLAGARPVPKLLGGETSKGPKTLTVPDRLATGSYFVLACADGKTSVNESDEKNNCRASAGKMAVRAS